MSTLHAPQLALLQLRLVPVSPSFTAITSQSVVRASYSADIVLPLIRKLPDSRAIGRGSDATWASSAAATDGEVSAAIAVSASPCPAAFRKSRRENAISAAC